MSVSTLFPDVEEVDFTIEHEGWNVYELSDGSILRIRPIVLKFLKAMIGKSGRGLGIASQNVMTVTTKKEMMGQPSPPFEVSQIPESEKTEVKATPKVEDWNYYKLADGQRIGVRLVLVSVLRLKDKYDPLGLPVYTAQTNNILTPVGKQTT